VATSDAFGGRLRDLSAPVWGAAHAVVPQASSTAIASVERRINPSLSACPPDAVDGPLVALRIVRAFLQVSISRGVHGAPPRQPLPDRITAYPPSLPETTMDFSLTDAQREVQRTARPFAERETLPLIGELDASAQYDRGLYEGMGAAGLL